MTRSTRSSLQFLTVCLLAIAAAGVVAICEAAHFGAKLVLAASCPVTPHVERSPE
jgi:hypothetical protein